jgi:hypothetical protein
MKARMLLVAVLLALVCNGCCYRRIVVEARVQSQITPVIPVVVAAKVDLMQ